MTYTVRSLAQRWECSEGMIRKLIRQGLLQSFTIGTLIRIPAIEVERFECIASNGSEAGSPLSGETMQESGTDERSTQQIGRARKPRPVASGRQATIHHGPWAG